MKMSSMSKWTVFFILFCFPLILDAPANANSYKALQGVDSVKAIFDFRDGVPESALVHLKLIHETYKDGAIQEMPEKPEFVVVFMGEAVKLVSKNREIKPEEKKVLDEWDQVITAMSKDGIQLEICMFAANFFGVKPESIPPEIDQVGNGWISSIGYQQKGYALVPVF